MKMNRKLDQMHKEKLEEMNLYWLSQTGKPWERDALLKKKNELISEERIIEEEHNPKLKQENMKIKLKRAQKQHEKNLDFESRKNIGYKLATLESQILKNLMKNYSILNETRKSKLLEMQKRRQKVVEKKKKLGKVFSRELIRILESAEAKESLYREENPIRPKLDIEKRMLNRGLVFDWLKEQRDLKIFGLEQSFRLKEILLKHESLFGLEFKEKFDLYQIIVALARLG